MMKNNYIKIALVFNLVVVLFLTNKAVVHKEDTLKNGKLVLMDLRPKDPRSLMQGDYMTLRYVLTQKSRVFRTGWWIFGRRVVIQNFDSIPTRGYAIVTLDDSLNLIADSITFNSELPKNLPANQTAIKYFYGKDNRQISIGAESFFFEEGTGHSFARAQYGGLRVDEEGNSILIGLYDEKLKLIKGEQKKVD